MKKYFYSHIIETTSISLSLGEMELSKEERKHLVELAEKNLHHAILDAVLSELSEKDKQRFVELVARDEHDKVWEFLNDRVEGIEDKISQTVEDLKKELHKDIDETQKNQETNE